MCTLWYYGFVVRELNYVSHFVFFFPYHGQKWKMNLSNEFARWDSPCKLTTTNVYNIQKSTTKWLKNIRFIDGIICVNSRQCANVCLIIKKIWNLLILNFVRNFGAHTLHNLQFNARLLIDDEFYFFVGAPKLESKKKNI